MKENERIQIALPGGEFEEDVSKFMAEIGLKFESIPKRYLIKVENMPVDFVILRAGSIPKLVKDKETTLKAGITGGDILWERGFGKEFGEELPLYRLIPDAKKSSLFIGVDEDFYSYLDYYNNLDFYDPQPMGPGIRNLSGFKIATKYPNIAKEVFREENIGDVKIIPVEGKDEAMQYIVSCCGVLGILSTKETLEANNIKILKIFYDVTVRMIDAGDKLTDRDREILDDVRERIAVAIERRKVVSSLI